MSIGVLTLDPATREVNFKGVSTTLTAREFALMQALMIRPGAILSRQELEDRIYGWNEEVESNAVEFLIHASLAQAAGQHYHQERQGGGMDGLQGKLTNSLQFRLAAALSALVIALALGAGTFSFWTAFEEANELQDD